MNLSNSARLFYPGELPPPHQTSAFWQGDPQRVIACEGLRHHWQGKSPCATGDPIAMNWGLKTDLGPVGSGYVGMLGSFARPTDVPHILQLDCLATDFFRSAAYLTFLCYNPYPKARSFQLDIGSALADLYDVVTHRFLASNVCKRVNVTLPADSAGSFVVTKQCDRMQNCYLNIMKEHTMRTKKLWMLAVVGAALSVSAVTAEDEPGDKALAWMRFENAPEQYSGKPYLWLGDRRIELAMDVKPAAEHVLYLLWGSKNDARTAKIVVNGKSQTVEGGGYDGFRWMKVALPGDLTGDHYQISIRQTGGKPAFLAEVRLVAPAETEGEADASRSTAHRMELQAAPEPAFPPLPDDPLQRSAEIAGFTISKVQRWLHEVALKRIEPDTGLYHPEGNFNYQDAWADCYPFLVWAAWLTDMEALNGPVRGALHAEIKHCPQGFFTDPRNTFGGSEYVKDGLIAIVEVTGKDEWFDRMKAVQDEIWANPTIETEYGKIPSTNIEVNGEQLQALARMYTMTGEKKYLEYAERLADHYLLPGDFVPTRLRDHGCEIIGGLGLLLAVESVHNPAKAEIYRPHIKQMLDTILEKGTNEDGIMYDTLGRTGRLSDGWGYNYVGYLCYDMAVGKPVYRERVEQTLRNLGKAQYRNGWGRGEGGNIDEVADSVEGGLYLLNRLPVAEGLAWADHEVIANIVHMDEEDHLWGTMKLQSNGVRTAIMHALMHTRGTIARPWQQGLKLGAIDADGGIEILLTADKPYEGKLMFDIPRHRHDLGFKQDWPRMNTLPEWFTVEPDDTRYTVYNVTDNTSQTVTGAELQKGLSVKVVSDKPLRLKVTLEK